MVGDRGRVRVRFAHDDAPEDPWGPDEMQITNQQAAGAPQPTSPQLMPVNWDRQQRTVPQATYLPRRYPASHVFIATSSHKHNTPSAATPNQHHRQLPSLQQLCLGTLGRHVTQLVEQMGGYLSFLPSDAKAALLACARRRGELTGPVLAALADMEWTRLDLSWCQHLFAAQVIQTAPHLPNIRVLDVTGFKLLVSGGWKQFARAWPNLSIIRLGGDPHCTKEALKALPHILPGIAPSASSARAVGHSSSVNSSSTSGSAGTSRSKLADHDLDPASTAPAAAGGVVDDDAGLDSWEDAFEEDDQASANVQSRTCNDGAMDPQQLISNLTPNHTAAASASCTDCRLRHLRALVWPDVPQEAVRLVQQRCPRVLINPPMKRDRITGQLPPRELDGSVPLDQPFMELVGPGVLEDLQQHTQQQEGSQHIVHIAEKFRAAYIQQANRLKEKERRMRQQEQKRQLKSSHALRTLNAWLDEPT